MRLTQMLFNLLDNASKYSLEGCQIEIDIKLLGAEVEIQVRDNGPGIPTELLPTIFDLFQQGARTLDRSQGGLGIGLNLVKRIVELHDGQVTASVLALDRAPLSAFGYQRLPKRPPFQPPSQRTRCRTWACGCWWWTTNSM